MLPDPHLHLAFSLLKESAAFLYEISTLRDVKSKQVSHDIIEIIFECRSKKGVDPTSLSGKEYIKDLKILSNS